MALDELLRNRRRLSQYAQRPGGVEAIQQATGYVEGGTSSSRSQHKPDTVRGRRNSGYQQPGYKDVVSEVTGLSAPSRRAPSTKLPGDIASAGEVVTSIALPEGGVLPVETPSGSPYMVRKPGSKNAYVDPVSGEELRTDVTAASGLRSLTALAKEKAAAAAEERSRIGQQRAYETSQKQIAKEKEAEQKDANAVKTNEYLNQGRKYYLDRQTGAPVPLQTDEEFAKDEAAKMAKLQKESNDKVLRERIKSLDIEQQQIKLDSPLPSESELTKLKESAAMTEQSLVQSGLKADEAGLKALESDPISAPVAKSYRETQAKLKAAEEVQANLRKIEQKKLDLERQRLDPDAWKQEKAAKLPTASDAELDDEISNNKEVVAELEGQLKAQEEPLKARTESVYGALTSAKEAFASALTGEDRIKAQSALDAAQARVSAWESDPQAQEAKAGIDATYKALQDRNQVANDAQNLRQDRAIESRKVALGEMMKTPLLAPVAQKIQALDEQEAARLAQMTAENPDGIPEEIKTAFAQDMQAQRQALSEEVTAADQQRQDALENLYQKYGKASRSEDWINDKDPANAGLLMNVDNEATKAGLTPQDAREYLELRTASDWSQPRRVDERGVADFSEDTRQLPNGQISVNPRHYLDQEEYDKAVNATKATPEAKAQAIAMRRELAAPLAAKALAGLQKNSDMAQWLEENTSGTPLDRMEQFQKQLKEGGALAASFQRFQGGTAGLATSVLGAISAITGDDWSQRQAQYFQDRAAAFEGAGEAAGKGTGTLGRFVSKVAGAVPSLIPAVATGVATGGLGLGTTASVIASSLTGGLQSLGGTYVDAYQAYKEQGLSDVEARSKALTPAIASGLVTTLATAAGGASGVESIFKPAVQSALKTALKTKLGSIAKEAGEEALEEFSDQALQGMIAAATYSPNKDIKDIFNEAIEAGLVGMALGGAVATGKEVTGGSASPSVEGMPADPSSSGSLTSQTVIEGAQAGDGLIYDDKGVLIGTEPKPTVFPEQQASLDRAVSSFVPSPDIVLPEGIQPAAKKRGPEKAAKEAVQTLVKVAQGASLESLPSSALESVGLQRTDKGIVALDKKVAPLVYLEKGQPVIRDEALQWLEAEEQLKIRDQIGKTEAERLAEINAPKVDTKSTETAQSDENQAVAVDKTQDNQTDEQTNQTPLRTDAETDVQSTQPEAESDSPTTEGESVPLPDGGSPGGNPKTKVRKGNGANPAISAKNLAGGSTNAPPSRRKAIGKGAGGSPSYAEFPTDTDAKAFTFWADVKRSNSTSKSMGEAQRSKAASQASQKLEDLSKELGVPKQELRAVLRAYNEAVSAQGKATQEGAAFQAEPIQDFISRTRPQQKVQSLNEFLAEKGVSSSPPSFPESHRASGGVSKPTAKAAAKKIEAAMSQWQDAKNKAQQEYESLVERGVINPPSRDQRLAEASTIEGERGEAARRLLAKRQSQPKENLPSDSKSQGEVAQVVVPQPAEGSIPAVEETITTPETASTANTAAESLGITPDGKFKKDGFVEQRIVGVEANGQPSTRKLTKPQQAKLRNAAKAIADTLEKAKRIKGVNLVVDNNADAPEASFNPDGSVSFNPRKLAERIALYDTDATQTPKQLVIHELIHQLASSKIPFAAYANLWRSLTPEAQETSKREYFRHTVGPDQALPDVTDSVAGAEFFAQIVEARLKGNLASQVWDNPTIAQQVLDMVRQYIQALKDLSGLFKDPEWKAISEKAAANVEANVRQALREAGLEEEFLGQSLNAPSPNGGTITPQQDAAYLAAVQSGDIETAQKMVDKAAKDAGYSRKVWRSDESKITTFDRNYLSGNFTSAAGFSFTTDKKTAEAYGDPSKYFIDTRKIRRFDYTEDRGVSSDRFGYDEEELASLLGLDQIDTTDEDSLDNWWGQTEVIRIDNIDDSSISGKGEYNGDLERKATLYIVRNPSKIKSADPVTYDTQGNVIPLSRRFNPESNSILYAPPSNPEGPSPISPGSPTADAPSNDAVAVEQEQYLKDLEALGDLRSDPEAMKALADAIRNKPAIASDPKRRAKMGVTPETRAVQEAALVAQTMNGIEVQRQADVFVRAKEAVIKDRAAVEKALFEKMESGAIFDTDDIAQAQQITELMQREVTLDPNNQALYKRYLELVNRWADNKTDTARALAIMRDPQQTPLQRMRQAVSVVNAPPLKVRNQIRAAWTPKQKSAEVKYLEKKIRDAENAQTAKLFQVELDRIKAIKDKDEVLAKYIKENKELQAEVLKRMALTNDDVILDPSDRYSMREALLETAGIKSAFAKYNKDQQNAVKLAMLGYSDAAIAQRTGFEESDVAKLAEDFRQNVLRPTIAQEVKAGNTFGKLLAAGIEKVRGILKAPTTGEFDDMRQTGQIDDAAKIQAEINRILGYSMPPARYRNKGGALTAKVVTLPNGQKVRMFIPFDPDDTRQFYRYARELSTRQSTKFDKIYEYWINGILSGPQTQVANIAGNAGQIAWNYTFQRMAEAMMNVAYRDPKSARLGEFPHAFKAFWKSAGPAWSQAAMAWDTEADNTRTEYLNEPLTVDFKAGDVDKVGGYRAAIPGKTGRAIRIPGRLLRFFDSLFKTGVLHAEATAQAYREGRSQGLKGSALDAFMTQRLEQKGSAPWQEAMKIADELLFQSDNWATKMADDFVRRKSRIENIEKRISQAEAMGDADEVTNLSKELASAKFVAGLMRFLFPFTKTPTNILRVGVRKAGGSAISGLWSTANGLYRMKDGKPFEKSYAKAQQIKDLSETFLAGLGWAFLNGITEGDDDDDKKMILIVGNRPYGAGSAGEKEEVMRKYGGTQVIVFRDTAGNELFRFNYGRYEPFATSLGVMVDTLREIKQGGAMTSSKAVNLVGSIGAHLMAQAESKSFMQGFSSINRTVEQIREGRFEPGQAAGKAIVSGIVPNLIRQSIRNADDFQRDFKTSGLAHEAWPSGRFAEPQIGPGGEPVRKGGNAASRLLFQVPNAPSKRTAETILQQYNLRHPEARIDRGPLTKSQFFAYNLDKSKLPLETAKDQKLFKELYERNYADVVSRAVAMNPLIQTKNPPESVVDDMRDLPGSALKRARDQFVRAKAVQSATTKTTSR